jgi:hypothetical protein
VFDLGRLGLFLTGSVFLCFELLVRQSLLLFSFGWLEAGDFEMGLHPNILIWTLVVTEYSVKSLFLQVSRMAIKSE